MVTTFARLGGEIPQEYGSVKLRGLAYSLLVYQLTRRSLTPKKIGRHNHREPFLASSNK